MGGGCLEACEWQSCQIRVKSVKLAPCTDSMWVWPTGVIVFNYTLTLYPAVLMSVGRMRSVWVLFLLSMVFNRLDRTMWQNNRMQITNVLFWTFKDTPPAATNVLDGMCVCVCLWEDLYLLSSFFRQKFSWITLWHASPSVVYLVKHFVQQVGATHVVVTDRFHSFHIHSDVLVCKNVFIWKGRW